MQPGKKKKSIYYKRAEIDGNGSTLQAYLDSALTQLPKPNDRVEFLDKEGTHRRFINSIRKQSGMIFGQMLIYEPGKDQPILVLDDNSTEYPIESFPMPQRKDGKKQEFLESVLYFGILENHVIVLQTQVLKSRDIEHHFTWLLRDRTKVLPSTVKILLSDQPTAKAREKIERMPVKKVVIGTHLESASEELPGNQEDGKEEKTLKFRPYGTGFDLLATVLGADWRRGLNLESSLDEANLRVNLEVTYFRKTTKAAHSILDNIATSMRHADPDDVKIHLEGGPVLKGNDLKFTGELSVQSVNGIIDSGDLYNEMFGWLKARITEGTIT